ncbi:hypothetical protein [Streptomyces sp. NPDC059759]|uniref:hypothetical protein n=1 Tax=Streptomyces sp. NPDC059759 TaxID=3346936 RepID=UPI00364C0C43
MTHRPYPSADRAVHQLDRHDQETPPLPDGSDGSAAFAMPRLVISDEAREALGAHRADIGRSLRAAFQPRPAGSE